ncbi:MAG: 3-oxoacyl-[acyl-carrier protein] reductase [Pseudonocardiales bacterium]|nr:3-oxoacyl-[acyl-carrier protein] reductase [Pseudonocardiales bacterium]
MDNPTYFSEEYKKTEDFRLRMAAVPAGRLASMEEFAKTALFLAGPESDFFYGQVIPFAGGWAV